MEAVKAIVQKIITEGKHGAFAVATSNQIEGSITFSLEPTVWKEKNLPEEGMMVLLTELRRKRAGWRAKEGRFLQPSDEQIANRKEQEMLEKAKVFIDGLKNKWFPTGDDKVWKQWVDYKRREHRDLLELLSSDVREEFKKRALFLLLVPSPDLNPIYWTDKVGKFYQGPDLETLTPDLRSYATDLIIEFYTMLKPVHCYKPKHAVETGAGISIYTSIPDKYHDALNFYNYCIITLLKVLPVDQGERIFPLFLLNDISTYYNMEDASGYNPFRSLLYSKVDENWKRKADIAMREIIRSEIAGETKPREKWEHALSCYAFTLNLQLYSEEPHYSVDLFADQMQFLVSEAHLGYELIESYNVHRIYKILSDNKYKEVRRLIAKFIILGNVKEFVIYSNDTLKVASMMLDALNQDDQEIAERIKKAIKEGNELLLERQIEQTVDKKSESDILAQMR